MIAEPPSTLSTAPSSARLPAAVTTKTPWHDIIVTELGGRIGASVCGSILVQLGATVIMPEGLHGTRRQAEHRAQLMAGKLSVQLDAQAASDVELLDLHAATL